MRALVVCGGQWHPAEVTRAGLDALDDSTFSFDWLDDAGGWLAERLADYALVVLTKANQMSASDHRPWATEEAGLALRDYVRSGRGLLIVHAGSAGYGAVSSLRALTGGGFATHPP